MGAEMADDDAAYAGNEGGGCPLGHVGCARRIICGGVNLVQPVDADLTRGTCHIPLPPLPKIKKRVTSGYSTCP